MFLFFQLNYFPDRFTLTLLSWLEVNLVYYFYFQLFKIVSFSLIYQCIDTGLFGFIQS